MLFMYGFRHLLKLELSPMEENVWITKEAMEQKKKWEIVKSILKLNFKKLLKLTLKKNLNRFFF
jgi:hypothetical protein